MQIVITDECDERFLELSNKLNEEYLENVGDVALNYLDHNSLGTSFCCSCNELG